MSRPLYVPLGNGLAEQLRNLGAECCTVDQLAEGMATNGREIIVVGTHVAAETQAEKLAAQGLSAARVLFVPTDSDAELRRALENPKHLFWRDVQPLRFAPTTADFKTYPSGIGFLDKNLRWGWRLPELGVVAGPYSAGKSTVLQQLAFNFVRTNGKELGDTGALICAWEDEAAEVQHNLRCFVHGISCNGGIDYDYLFDKIQYVHREPDAERLISWYIDLVKFHHARFGTKFFTLDPWNELDHRKDIKQLETDYIRDVLKEFRRLVDKLKIIILIATHVPAKMIKGDGSIEPFKIAHAFGSGNFGNKADRGICVVRTKKFEKERGHTIIRLDKAKVERKMGIKGTIAARLSDQFFSFDYDGHATSQVQDVWKD